MNRLLLALFILSFAANSRSEPLPFDPQGGLVKVDVVVNGMAKGAFGIDTGADRLYIDCNFAEKNHLKLNESNKKLRVAGLDGVAEASLVDLRSLRIADSETLYNLEATAIDMNDLAGPYRDKHPDGLIGHEILSRFYVTVDYPQREFELISHEPEFLCGGDFVSIPFELQRHLIVVDVYFGGGVEVPMILDYCASLTTISPFLAKELGYDPEGPSRVTIPNVSIDCEVESVDVPAVIRDHSLLHKSNPDAEFEGILGVSFLYRHKITVDYKRHKVYVHRN